MKMEYLLEQEVFLFLRLRYIRDGIVRRLLRSSQCLILQFHLNASSKGLEAFQDWLTRRSEIIGKGVSERRIYCIANKL